MANQLTNADVSRLLSDPSGEARAETATKIARQFGQQALSPREREIAQEIIRIMAKDAEVRVREALSVQLKDCDDLPRDVATTLAKDVGTVALPLLQFSRALSDTDLIEIVRSHDPEKQVAIAKRKSLSAHVSHSLVEDGAETAVATLMENPEAEIGESALRTALERFPESTAVADGMVHRAALPATIAERLVSLVSDAYKEYLVSHHELAPEVATDLMLQSRERATIGLLAPGAGDAEAERLVNQLITHDRLTPSLMLRALCMGDIVLFEVALAALAGVAVTNARALVHDKGALGLRAIYERAKLPESLYAAYRTAIDVIHETEIDGGPDDGDRYRRRIMERILTQFEHLGPVCHDDVDYLVAKLTKLETK